MMVVVLACGPVAADGDDTSGTEGDTTLSPTSSAPGDPSTTPLDDDDDGVDDAPPKFDMPHGGDDTTGGAPMTIPDCPSFDPSRVYLHGTLQEGAAYAEALAGESRGTTAVNPGGRTRVEPRAVLARR